MLGQSETTIWDFALAWYKVPGVQADCLTAQNDFGLDVTALIFALYRARHGLGFDAVASAQLARTMSAQFVEPLRNVRVALKTGPQEASPGDRQALREEVKIAELHSEKLILKALVSLPVQAYAINYEGAVCAIADAYKVGNDYRLHALLKRLANAAQNMGSCA